METLAARHHNLEHTDLSDDEIVARYLIEQNDKLFRILVERHHRRLYTRFLSEIKNAADAKDLEQQLWLRVFRNLNNYQKEGKFAEYLSRIAGNLIADYWRSKGRSRAVFTDQPPSFESDSSNKDSLENHSASNEPPVADALHNAELVRYLISELIPNLPADQRLAWLLRHESEYWEPAQRLDWCHLAELNGISEDQAWAMFESARNKLMTAACGESQSAQSLDNDETLIFIVWSQAQRLHKEEKFTWEYFAQLLNIPVNTMKTRYRAAQKNLSDGLKSQEQRCA